MAQASRMLLAPALLAAFPAAVAAAQDAYGPVLSPGEREAPQDVPPGIPAPLAQAAQAALETYPALAAARSQIRATQSEIRAARWLRYPSVAAELVTRGEGRVTPELEVVQPLWTGGRIKGNVDRALALRNVADARLSEVALDVLLRLSEAYYEVARTTRLEAIYTESLTEHRRLVESMERRVEQEVSPRTDLELARARAAQVEQQRGLVVAQRQAALERFRQLVGEPGADIGPLPDYSPAEHHPAGDEALAQSIACDPSIRRLNAEVEVAQADRRISQAAILPQIGVQYSYDRFRGSGVGVAVRAQTNGGLSPLALADAAAARAQSAEFQVTLAQREISEKVNLDLVENRSAGARMESTQTAAQSTLDVTNSFLRQFVAGRRTWLDVMNAVREAVEARVALVEVQNSAMASAARIRLRTCEWLPMPSAGPA